MIELLNQIKSEITNPHTLAMLFKLIMDLSDGSVRLEASTRLELQAELDTLSGGAL